MAGDNSKAPSTAPTPTPTPGAGSDGTQADRQFAAVALQFGLIDMPTAERLLKDLLARRNAGETIALPTMVAAEGLLSPPAVRKVLVALDQTTLACDHCGSRFDLRSFPAATTYQCRQCNHPLNIEGYAGFGPPPAPATAPLPAAAPTPVPAPAPAPAPAPSASANASVNANAAANVDAAKSADADAPTETATATPPEAANTGTKRAGAPGSGSHFNVLPDFIAEQARLLDGDFDETTLEDTGRMPTLAPDDMVDDEAPVDSPTGPYISAGTTKGTSAVMVTTDDDADAFGLGTDDIISGRGGLVHALRISRSVKAEYDLPTVDVPSALRAGTDVALHRTPAHLRFGFEGDLKTSPEVQARGVEVALLARDRDLRRLVRMRLLKQGSDATNDDIERFLEEIQIVAQLEHPGILPIYELGLDSTNRLFAVERQVRTTRTLASMLEARRQFRAKKSAHSAAPAADTMRRETGPSMRRLVEILLDVADTLAFAHAHGVEYRNLWPGNVAVGEFGEVVVTDWSRAHVRGRPETRAERLVISERRAGGHAATIDGSPFSNPCYLPPEQAAGELERISARSDVYALGAVAYEIFSGEPPFTGSDTWAILAEVRTSRPIPLRKIRAARHVPLAVTRVVERAISRQPDDRFADASEFAVALRHALDSSALLGPAEFIPRWLKWPTQLLHHLASLTTP